MLKLTNVFHKNVDVYTAINRDGSRKHQYIINQGGTRSSKTYSILQILVEIARKYAKQIDIAGISVPHLKSGVLNDMPKVMDGFGLDFYSFYKSTDKRIIFPSGGVINFIAMDKLGSAHGGARDILYVNEANHHKFPIVEQLMMRTAETIFIDFNPTSRFWAHDIVDKEPERASLIRSTYLDNQYLSKNIVSFIESKKGNGDNNFWRVYGLGEIGVAEGLVFDNWETGSFDIHRFERYRNGIDWGFSIDPFVFVRVAIENNTLYICEEIYERGLLNKDSAEQVRRIVRGEHVWCDSAEPKSINEYQSYGVSAIAVKKGAGSIESGIKKIQSYDRVIIHGENCPNILTEFQNYQWKKNKNGEWLAEPASGFDHGIDAIRYAIESEMIYSAPEYDNDNEHPYRSVGSGGWMN